MFTLGSCIPRRDLPADETTAHSAKSGSGSGLSKAAKNKLALLDLERKTIRTMGKWDF